MILKSGSTGESLYYSVSWEELRDEANRVLAEHLKSDSFLGDVRYAGYALDVLGIPNRHSEADQDEKGNWIVYWR